MSAVDIHVHGGEAVGKTLRHEALGREVIALVKIVLAENVENTGVTLEAGRVQRYAVHTTSQGLEEEVRASLRAYESLWRSRADMLASVSLVISNMSDVRAAFSTRDQATNRDTAGELWAKISHDDAIFLVTDPQGTLVASLGGETRIPELSIVRAAGSSFPRQAIGFIKDEAQLYQVVVTPVYVQSQHGPALLNVLVG